MYFKSHSTTELQQGISMSLGLKFSVKRRVMPIPPVRLPALTSDFMEYKWDERFINDKAVSACFTTTLIIILLPSSPKLCFYLEEAWCIRYIYVSPKVHCPLPSTPRLGHLFNEVPGPLLPRLIPALPALPGPLQTSSTGLHLPTAVDATPATCPSPAPQACGGPGFPPGHPEGPRNPKGKKGQLTLLMINFKTNERQADLKKNFFN